MNASTIKPFVKQALQALELALSGRPLIQWALHMVDGAILQALDDGTFDAAISRAADAHTPKPGE